MAQSESKRPSFDQLVASYPSPLQYSGAEIKRLIGGGIDDTAAPAAQQWLGGSQGDTCTIRMSRALNYASFPIPHHPAGFRTAKGRDGFNYGFAVQELHKWLISRLGRPDVLVRGKPVKRDAFAGKKGIIVFDIVFDLNADNRTRALGHADLWDGSTFYDEIDGTSNAQRDFFTVANAVSLWICTGDATLPTV